MPENRTNNPPSRNIYDVRTVAELTLSAAKAQNIELSPLQLMKLVYIAHGFYLAIKGKPLFFNRIEAWKYGPVIPDLYHMIKNYGNRKISSDMIVDIELLQIEEEDKEFIRDVIEKYGGLTGGQLSALTHKKDTPWQQIFHPSIFHLEIPNFLITKHYESILSDGRK